MEQNRQTAEGVKQKAKARVVIDAKWCKGCTICVQFCPKNVLAMDGLVAVVNNPDECTGCELCDVLCPDFAVTVHHLEPGPSKGE